MKRTVQNCGYEAVVSVSAGTGRGYRPAEQEYPATKSRQWWQLFRMVSQWHVDVVIVERRSFSIVAAVELDDAIHLWNADAGIFFWKKVLRGRLVFRCSEPRCQKTAADDRRMAGIQQGLINGPRNIVADAFALLGYSTRKREKASFPAPGVFN